MADQGVHAIATGDPERARWSGCSRRAPGPRHDVSARPRRSALEQPSARLHRRHLHRLGQVPVCGSEYRLKAGRRSTRALSAVGWAAPACRTMTRSLVVAPQSIDDTVMAGPLLAALAAARRNADGSGCCPGLRRRFRRSRRSARSWSCRSATAGSTRPKRRRVAATPARPVRHRLRAPNSIKSALLPGSPACGSHRCRGEGRSLLFDRRLATPKASGRDGRVLRGRWPPATSTPARVRCGSMPGCRQRLPRPGRFPSGYWAFAPAPIRARQALTVHTTPRSPRRSTPPTGRSSPCSARPAKRRSAIRSRTRHPAPAGACQQASLLEAIAFIAAARGLASNDSGLITSPPAPRAAGGSLRLDQPLHSPPLNPRGAHPLAEGRAPPRVHAVLRPRLPSATTVAYRSRTGAGARIAASECQYASSRSGLAGVDDRPVG